MASARALEPTLGRPPVLREGQGLRGSPYLRARVRVPPKPPRQVAHSRARGEAPVPALLPLARTRMAPPSGSASHLRRASTAAWEAVAGLFAAGRRARVAGGAERGPHLPAAEADGRGARLSTVTIRGGPKFSSSPGAWVSIFEKNRVTLPRAPLDKGETPVDSDRVPGLIMRTTGTATSPIAWPEETRGSAPWPDAARQVSPAARKRASSSGPPPRHMRPRASLIASRCGRQLQVFPAEE